MITFMRDNFSPENIPIERRMLPSMNGVLIIRPVSGAPLSHALGLNTQGSVLLIFEMATYNPHPSVRNSPSETVAERK